MLRSSPWPPSPKLPELRLSQESSPALPVPDHSGSRSPASPHLMPSGRTCQAQRHFHFPGPHAVSPLGAHWRGSPPRTPPFHPARRPLGSAGQIPGTCDGPRPRASAATPTPRPPRAGLCASGPRPASLGSRPRGPGGPALLKSPGAHHDAGTAGRHDAGTAGRRNARIAGRHVGIGGLASGQGFEEEAGRGGVTTRESREVSPTLFAAAPATAPSRRRRPSPAPRPAPSARPGPAQAPPPAAALRGLRRSSTSRGWCLFRARWPWEFSAGKIRGCSYRNLHPVFSIPEASRVIRPTAVRNFSPSGRLS